MTQSFWPDQVLKDAVVALCALVVVGALALRFGAPIEPLANPADTAYVPRPEWYFLWLFQALKYFPGNLEFVGAVLLPGLAVVLLAVFPYLDRNPERRLSMRYKAVLLCAGCFVGISYLGIRAVESAPKPEHLTRLQQQGQKIFLDRRCNACHGINGGGGNAGPDLAQSAPLKRDRVEAILADPTRFNARSIMPPTDLPKPKLEALVAYLTSLKSDSRLPQEPQAGPKKPASHLEEQWYIDHKFEVRKDPSQCGKCHDPEFCQTCHSKRRPDSHLNNWLKFHFGTAREKPEYCRVCHEQSFCDSCHRTLMHSATWLKSGHASGALKNPGICQNCHHQVMCDTCHQGAKPENHTADWLGNHGSVARNNTTVCEGCHRTETCKSCHGVIMPHPADWISRHGRFAEADARLCARCHNGAGKGPNCTSCHATLRPSFHTANWVQTHPKMAMEKRQLCSMCHAESFCNACHQTPMPHAKGWVMSHGKRGASLASGSFCYNCHDRKKMCGSCHQIST
jgi:mono/diheme cytochrome c family protein